MEIRLLPEKGGDGTIHGITVMNDTGSSILTILDVDLPHLGDWTFYHGFAWNIEIADAAGPVESLKSLYVQVRLVHQDHTPWTKWVTELAIIRPIVPGIARLSGRGIREHFFFATTPGNNFVAVSRTKHDLKSLL